MSRGAWEKIRAEVTSWPLQYILLTVEPDGVVADGPQVSVRSGAWGTAPVFAVATGDQLRGHWDPVRLYPLLRGGEPLEENLAAYFLATFETPYARQTLLREVKLLTERSVACWPAPNSTLSVRYPAPAEPSGERSLRPDADVLPGLWQCLTSSVRRWLPPGNAIAGCELSGGLDSALVTAAVADVTGTGPRTYGLALTGPAGIAQRVRRADLVRRFGGVDTTVPFASWPPLAPTAPGADGSGSGRAPGSAFGRGAAGLVTSPWEECYLEVTDAMLERAAADGVQMIFTGFGGDELSRPRRSRYARGAEPLPVPKPEDIPCFLTPAARVAALGAAETIHAAPAGTPRCSAVETVALSASLYLRRGIWPVHPLCTPELVRLCAWLPAPWRADRLFERRLLADRGISSRVAYASETDNFEPVLADSIRHAARKRLDSLFAEPLLADCGLVDGGRLRAAYRDWCERGGPVAAVSFYAAATVELTLRALTGCAG